ncbi:MAG: ice-binding family protein [Terriglobia bacterium]
MAVDCSVTGTFVPCGGNILVLASITLDTGATITGGRTLAQNGAVTRDHNTVSHRRVRIYNQRRS